MRSAMTQLRWDGTNPAAGRREPPGPVRPGPIPSRDTTPPAPDRDRPTPPTAGCAWTRRACGQHRRPSAGFRDDLHLVRLADLGLRPTERSSTSTTSPTAGDWTCVWSNPGHGSRPGYPRTRGRSPDRNASDCDDFRRRAHRCGIPQSGRATRRPRGENPWPAAGGEVRAFCISTPGPTRRGL